MPQGARTKRVGEEFREILAEEIQRLKDPRVGFVTVTGVRVSPDLHVAWVYFTAFGDDKARAGSRAALRSASAHLRHELGRQVRLKSIPELRFEEDVTPAAGERIDRIIEELHEANDVESQGQVGADGS
jgi:ribosome-binding factor A